MLVFTYVPEIFLFGDVLTVGIGPPRQEPMGLDLPFGRLARCGACAAVATL